MTAPGSGRRVLLVDDAAEVRLLMQVVLEFSGFDVTTVEDGPAALAAAQQDPPDVVLLDVQLPGMDGRSVLRALQQSPSTAGVPVVFLTAEPASEDAALLAGGARGVLRKPFDPDDVADQIAALL